MRLTDLEAELPPPPPPTRVYRSSSLNDLSGGSPGDSADDVIAAAAAAVAERRSPKHRRRKHVSEILGRDAMGWTDGVMLRAAVSFDSLRPHAHQTPCEKQSKLGCANPVVATGLFRLQATSNT